MEEIIPASQSYRERKRFFPGNQVRIDKYLKISGIFKRRTLAQTACRSGRILINGRPAKPGDRVRVDDEITLLHPAWKMVIRVKMVPERKLPPQEELYEVLSREKRGEDL